MGPGVIVLVAGNDAGGLSLYAQAGQNYGLRLVWVLLLLAPVLFVNQEMVARLGAVTGAGHARLIYGRFGRNWGRFAVGDLLVLNALTLVTEFIGIALASEALGLNRLLTVPLAAILLISVTARGSFRGWERTMYGCVVVSLLAVPLAALVLAHTGSAGMGKGVVTEGLQTRGVLFGIALTGTTVAPWQLFFQQSNVVDKRITSRWVRYERLDTAIGTVLFVLTALAITCACAAALGGSQVGSAFTDAGGVAGALKHAVGWWAGTSFAVLLLDASILGAAAVTLSTSYAISDATGYRQSLHRPWREARRFHGSFAVLVVASALVVLVPGLPLGLVTVMVNVLAGVLLPSATVFLLLLCNDVEVLGPWTNPRWLNALAVAIVAGLVVLSGLLVLSTLFPHLTVRPAAYVLSGGAVLVCVITGLATGRRRPTTRSTEPRQTWTMPVLERLQPTASLGRTMGLVGLRIYLLAAVVLVVIKTLTLAS